MANKSIEELRELVKSTKGKFFTARFLKKDGEVREFRGRIDVKKFNNPNARICVNGTSNTKAHIPKYVTVYDQEKDAMRSLNLETLLDLKCGNIEYHKEI